MKRQVPLFITFFVGMIVLVQWFVPRDPIGMLGARFSQWFDIIASFAIILGGLNLLKHQTAKLKRRDLDAFFALVAITGFLITAAVGMTRSGGDVPGNPYNDPGSHFYWIYLRIFSPLASTMFALLAFFVASASYRAFRARNTEATVLLVAGIILMLGRVPIGRYLTGWLPEPLQFLHLPNLASWIFTVPNAGGARAILVGISLGIMATSLRLILGIERSFLGSDEKR